MSLLNVPFIRFSPDDTPRPWLPITVINPHRNKKIKLYGLIYTGADECALPASYAVLLGHDLQAGYSKTYTCYSGYDTSSVFYEGGSGYSVMQTATCS